MISVGNLLRSAREKQHRSVEQIADELCLLPRYLYAIEADDLPSLPGVFFYKSFVKQYARTLGMDPARLQSSLEEICSGQGAPADKADKEESAPVLDPRTATFLPPRTALSWAAADSEPKRSQYGYRELTSRRMGMPAAALVLAVLICSGFYAWWMRPPAAHKQVVAAVPASSETPNLPARVNAPNSGASDSAAQNGGPEPAAAPEESSGVVQRAQLDLSATEPTWVSITSNGKEIFSGVLQPSQTKTLTGIESARMRIGNAGGLEVRWKGKPMGPFGARGEVRTVVLTEGNYEIVTPPAEAKTDDSTL
jgi:cytoskeleton protein RodZ